MTPIIHKRATPADVPILTQLRCDFLEEAYDGIPIDPELRQSIADYFSETIRTGEFIAFFTLADGKPIACSGLKFRRSPPSTRCRSGVDAYILNMYTAPPWRGKGIATALLNELIQVAKEAQCTRVRLHALPKAQTVYARVGFKPIDGEMELAF